jgi:hypothetical protein
MRNSHSTKINYQIEKNRKFQFGNDEIKTTNVNILLNRVRQENKNNKKKKIILSISVIGILSFICILVFGN